jgi:hypothetical protein
MNGNFASGISSWLVAFSAVLGLSSVTANATDGAMPAGVNEALHRMAIHRKAILLLRKALRRENQWIATLAKVGGNEDLSLFSTLLNDANSDVRVSAADAVLRIERRDSHPVL